MFFAWHVLQMAAVPVKPVKPATLEAPEESVPEPAGNTFSPERLQHKGADGTEGAE